MMDRCSCKQGFIPFCWILVQISTIFFYCLPARLASAAESRSNSIPRHQLCPLPDQQVSFQIEGIEKTRWHFGENYPRPFFYPYNGPSGESLTRMGHPGAPNHDHHRSIWLAHHSINGVDFWSDNTPGCIRQKMWLAYLDSDQESIMAVLLDWIDGENVILMEQETIVALMSLPDNEHGLEIQITMRPPANNETVELGKTNFGFLAVRVAKSISGYFGGGTISSSAGEIGEKNIFGKIAKWVDYSGPIAVGKGPNRRITVEGITYFDHPSNPRFPTYWHVREDGWMGASFNMKEPYTITRKKPLVLRYLLYAHYGGYDPIKAEEVYTAFLKRQGFQVTKRTKPHGQFDVGRISLNATR